MHANQFRDDYTLYSFKIIIMSYKIMLPDNTQRVSWGIAFNTPKVNVKCNVSSYALGFYLRISY